MTLTEYLDNIRFSLSSIPELAPNQQFNQDAQTFDFLNDLKDKAIPLNQEQIALWRELEIKIPHIYRLSTNFWASSNPI